MGNALSFLVVALAVVATAAAARVLVLALRQERRLQSSLEDRFEEERLAMKGLRREVETLLDSTSRERARMDGERGGGRRKQQRAPEGVPDVPDNGGVPWTREGYLAFVESSGRTIPAVERALGL